MSDEYVYIGSDGVNYYTFDFEDEASAIDFAKKKDGVELWCHVIKVATGQIIFNSVTYKDL